MIGFRSARRSSATRFSRPSRCFVFLPSIGGAVLLLSAIVHADPDEGKRHFTNGVHLFEDRNFAGALVEFEASFRQKATASALQNIAVCQKGLFRYAEAISTLERMLRDFKAQLSVEDTKAAEDAIRDMSALLGTIIVQVVPGEAQVSVNDALLTPEALKLPVRLAAGEYRLVAEAPGYARQEKIITVVSGQKDLPISMTLTPLSGTLLIRAHDTQAAIAIDGAQVGYDEWKGPVFAGPHEIYVYTQVLRHKSHVVAYAGQITTFEAKLAPEDLVPENASSAPAGLPPYVPPVQRGIFGYLRLGGDSLGSTDPPGIQQEKRRSPGTFGGISLGYRFSTAFAVELGVETANHTIAGCLIDAGTQQCADSGATYHLQSTRVGPAVRLMTSGKKGRLVGTIGLGAAVQSLSLGTLGGADGNKTGWGSYLTLVGGYELNLGHFLLDAGLNLTGETADEQKVGIKNIGAVGIELRLGYGQW